LTEDVKSALPSGPCRGGRRYIYIYIFIKYIYIYIIFAYVYKHTYQDKSQHE
jgi:hypothetical protein